MFKTSNYFIKRYTQQEEIAHHMALVREGQLKNVYRNARRELEANLAIFIQKYRRANGFTRADAEKFLNVEEIAEFRYTIGGYIKKINKYVQEAGNDVPAEALALKKELDILSGRTRVSRMMELKALVNGILADMSMKNHSEIKEHLDEVIQYAYADALQIMKNNTLAHLDKEVIEGIANQDWKGLNYSRRVWKSRKGLARRAMKMIADGFVQGHDFKTISNKLSDVMQQGFYESRRLIETETTFALERTKKKVFDDLKVTKYQYIATIDKNTSDTCKILNNQIFNMKDRHIGLNCPPMHPFCRSTTIPYITKEKK